jgi:hypothetical protein
MSKDLANMSTLVPSGSKGATRGGVVRVLVEPDESNEEGERFGNRIWIRVVREVENLRSKLIGE